MRATLEAWDRELRFEVPDDHIGRHIANGSLYERELLEDVKRRVRPGGLAVDVGAHIGNHSIYFAAIAGLQVEAFEPWPASLKLLRRNVKANKLEDLVRIHPVALGRQRSPGRLEPFGVDNSGMVRILEDPDGDAEIITLDELGLEAVRIIKIDVEGAELAVLDGAQRTIAASRPIVYVEAQTEHKQERLYRWFTRRGYRGAGRFGISTPTLLFVPGRRK